MIHSFIIPSKLDLTCIVLKIVYINKYIYRLKSLHVLQAYNISNFLLEYDLYDRGGKIQVRIGRNMVYDKTQKNLLSQSAEAVEYTECTTAEG